MRLSTFSPVVLVLPLLLLGACTERAPVTAPASLHPGDAPAPSVTVIEKDHTSIRDMDVTVYNDCTNEEFPGVADASLNWFTRLDAAGGYHDSFTLRTHVAATDPATGAEYVANQLAMVSANIAAGETRTLEIRLRLIGKGDAPNQQTRWSVHVTRNANGVRTVEFDRMIRIGDGCTVE